MTRVYERINRFKTSVILCFDSLFTVAMSLLTVSRKQQNQNVAENESEIGTTNTFCSINKFCNTNCLQLYNFIDLLLITPFVVELINI